MKTLLALLTFCSSATAACAQEPSDTVVIHFPFDRSALTVGATATLDSFVRYYSKEGGASALQIRGHCDAVGSDDYNDDLARRRTFSVQNYLLSRGLPKTAVALARGYGERQPLNDNRTPEERSLNRRVEIVWARPSTTEAPPPPPPVPNNDTAGVFSPAAIDTAREGSTLRLRNINFYGGRHTFLPQAQPALDELVEVMTAHPTLVIEIQGHICCRYGFNEDGLDLDANDMNLSYNRARAVYYYLVQRGIDKRRMTYRGFGSEHPLVWPEESEADRTLNRRVEIKIIKR